MTASNPVYKRLFHFDGTNGAWPNSLAQGTDGNLYGTTQYGGANGAGTVFQLTLDGSLTIIHDFCNKKCLDGAIPASGLLLASDGDFYGTTYGGGKQSAGTVFKISTKGKLTTLYSFCSDSCFDGAYPAAPLVQGTDGNFYGTTTTDGANYEGGTVFKITPKGQFTTLYSFCADSCFDGALPNSALIQNVDGNFYGTTAAGGAPLSAGTAFKITPDGVLTTLHAFCTGSCPDGEDPVGLVLGTDGNFYGVAWAGGPYGLGTVFGMTTAGAVTTLYGFCGDPGCPDGQLPLGSVVEGTDGNFYGTTSSGGVYGIGTIYMVTPNGTLTTLHSFKGQYQGRFPLTPLVQATNGDFYGTTSRGGKGGSIYRLTVGLGPFVESIQFSGKVGQTVMVLGQDFIGATAVSFNGKAASYRVLSGTCLRALVPHGATSGSITVSTPGGTLTSNKPFVVTQ